MVCQRSQGAIEGRVARQIYVSFRNTSQLLTSKICLHGAIFLSKFVIKDVTKKENHHTARWLLESNTIEYVKIKYFSHKI
jgi:hypothetical protein